VVIGGGFEGRADLATGDSDLSFAGVTQNLANAVRLVPDLGPSRTVPGLIHAFGFSGHGFALCPLIGQVVTDLATGRNHGFDLAPFAVDRF